MFYSQDLPEGLPKGQDHHGVRVAVSEVDVVDELDGASVPHHVAANRDSKLELPLLFDSQEQPDDNPEKQVEDGADDAGQDRAVEAALVDQGVVVQQGAVADRQRDQDAHGGAVGEVGPEAGLAFPQDDVVLVPLVRDEGHELLVTVHVEDARGRGDYDAAEAVE